MPANPAPLLAPNSRSAAPLRLQAKAAEKCLWLMGSAANPLPDGTEIVLQSEVGSNSLIW